MPQTDDCNWLSNRELAVGATVGQGALMAVTQIFSSNVLAPAEARFLMSAPPLELWSVATCTGGLPTMVFPRMMLPWEPAARKSPFEFPKMSFCSIVLSILVALIRPIPKFPIP